MYLISSRVRITDKLQRGYFLLNASKMMKRSHLNLILSSNQPSKATPQINEQKSHEVLRGNSPEALCIGTQNPQALNLLINRSQKRSKYLKKLQLTLILNKKMPKR